MKFLIENQPYIMLINYANYVLKVGAWVVNPSFLPVEHAVSSQVG